jgi:RNA polymerase primary sigma factor
MRESILSELRNVVSELSEREQQVMEFRLRGDGVEVQPEEIAQALNLTRDRVRQIEVQAIRKLRIIAQQRRLRELL